MDTRSCIFWSMLKSIRLNEGRFKREYLERTKLILESKLSIREKIRAMNTWAIYLT